MGNLLSVLLDILGAILTPAKSEGDNPLARTPEPHEMSHPTWSLHWDD
jgi:hypothetical protein